MNLFTLIQSELSFIYTVVNSMGVRDRSVQTQIITIYLYAMRQITYGL